VDQSLDTASLTYGDDGRNEDPAAKIESREVALAAESWRQVLRICLSWIQPYPHGTILRHLLNMVNSFLYSSTNYFENRLLSNDLIIVRNHGEDE
jgi:hypothetical protein